MSIRETCWGDGFIVVCPDDICNGLGYCIHGDGEMDCPDCHGSGEASDDEDWDDYDAYQDQFEDEQEIAGVCPFCNGEFGYGWTTCNCEVWEDAPLSNLLARKAS